MNDFAGMTSLPDDWVGSIASVPCPCHVRLRSARPTWEGREWSADLISGSTIRALHCL